MKIAWATLGMVLCFVLGLVVAQRNASAQVFTPAPEEMGKKCSFQSDCKGFGACNSGHCEKSPY